MSGNLSAVVPSLALGLQDEVGQDALGGTVRKVLPGRAAGGGTRQDVGGAFRTSGSAAAQGGSGKAGDPGDPCGPVAGSDFWVFPAVQREGDREVVRRILD